METSVFQLHSRLLAHKFCEILSTGKICGADQTEMESFLRFIKGHIQKQTQCMMLWDIFHARKPVSKKVFNLDGYVSSNNFRIQKPHSSKAQLRQSHSILQLIFYGLICLKKCFMHFQLLDCHLPLFLWVQWVRSSIIGFQKHRKTQQFPFLFPWKLSLAHRFCSNVYQFLPKSIRKKKITFS